MSKSFQKIGSYISILDNRNTDGSITNLMGISIDKCYIPSVANVIGTDLRNYKVIRKGQFACSLMQVSRDQKIPLAMYSFDQPAIMSPAYVLFEVNRLDELLPEYMELWFKRAEFDREASFYAVGGVRGSLDWEDFCNMRLPVPSINEQSRIVHAYKVVTDRIALLERINQNLHQQAESIFNKFYDESEEQKTFTSLISVLGGGTPKTGNPEFWDGSIPFFTPKDVGSPYTFQTEKYITESGLNHCNSRLYPKNTSFVTARGTVGKVSLAGKPMAMNQSCYALASETIDPLLVYFYTLRAVDSLKHKASGAVFDAIVTRDFDSEIISVLPDEAAQTVLSAITPMMEAIHNNAEENIRLTLLRDLLLPKLMSGEIDVSDINL